MEQLEAAAKITLPKDADLLAAKSVVGFDGDKTVEAAVDFDGSSLDQVISDAKFDERPKPRGVPLIFGLEGIDMPDIAPRKYLTVKQQVLGNMTRLVLFDLDEPGRVRMYIEVFFEG